MAFSSIPMHQYLRRLHKCFVCESLPDISHKHHRLISCEECCIPDVGKWDREYIVDALRGHANGVVRITLAVFSEMNSVVFYDFLNVHACSYCSTISNFLNQS